MSKANSELDWARAPPPSGPVWRTITNAIYNPKEKSFLGRTPKRWGIVLTFYMVFYAVLALMFAACMGGLFMSLDPKMPTYTLGKSLIGSNPGVAARPLPNLGLTVTYDVNNRTEVSLIVAEIDEFMQHYQTLYPSEECSVKDNFGYPDTPCFFIKLNKIIDWHPECYNDASNLPAEMSDELKGYIKTVDASKMNQLWVSCWEEKSNQTKIEYPWGQGLPALYYPYTNQENYWSPLVAVRLTPPVNEIAVVRCRVWAKNVIYNKSMKEPSGYTRLQLHVKDLGNSTDVEQ